MTQPSIFDLDPRPCLAVDWSSGRLDVTNQPIGDNLPPPFDQNDPEKVNPAFEARVNSVVSQVKTIEELIASLPVPHKIVFESSLESFIPGRRQTMIALAREHGHEIYIYNPKFTARRRIELGWPKTDAIDATVIWNVANNTNTHIYPAVDTTDEWRAKVETDNRDYFVIKMSKRKPADLIKPAKVILGRFSKLSDADKAAFGNTKMDGYNESMLAATYFGALHTTSRDEFERLLGLHGSGFPSLLRSEVHHHGWKMWIKRDDGLTFADYRRAIRRLRATFVAAGVTP